jgi:hypothetical protein
VARANAQLLEERKQGFDQDEVKQLLGPPEVTIPVSDVQQLFLQSPGGTPDLLSSAVTTLYHKYCLADLPETMPVDLDGQDWSRDRRFLDCEVWIYEWSEPRRIYVGGWLPRRTDVVLSPCLLFRGNLAVGWEYLVRNAPEKGEEQKVGEQKR